ncbi:hypothetical protein F7734_44990 [Scytonema sp. UIC 10036]|uniref:hypothetical protein n=1 Tax=Scytonema sp. UIC 10036 TaxID=2304196 RepID=UPI0012DAE944|nr:hypothetical protein [Scytonema sp. UIC 10036]MUG99071.1 hypothetical protein [Scytonema sp. UIC 10036]
MTNLVNYYQEIKNHLHSQLKAARTTQVVARILQNEIQKIEDLNGEYINGLTPSQARLAIEQLNALSLSLSNLMIIKLSEPHPPKHKPEKLTSKSQRDIAKDLLKGALIGGTAGLTTAGLPGILLGSGVGALTNTFAKAFIPEVEDKDRVVTQVAPEKGELEIDVDTLLSNLQQSLERIDREVANCLEVHPKPTSKPEIEEYLDVLESLQDLIGQALEEEDKLSPLMHKQIKRLTALLKNYGIEVRVYKPDSEASRNAEYFFEIEPSLEPSQQDYITVKPAFVKGDELVLRGRIIAPAFSS